MIQWDSLIILTFHRQEAKVLFPSDIMASGTLFLFIFFESERSWHLQQQPRRENPTYKKNRFSFLQMKELQLSLFSAGNNNKRRKTLTHSLTFLITVHLHIITCSWSFTLAQSRVFPEVFRESQETADLSCISTQKRLLEQRTHRLIDSVVPTKAPEAGKHLFLRVWCQSSVGVA